MTRPHNEGATRVEGTAVGGPRATDPNVRPAAAALPAAWSRRDRVRWGPISAGTVVVVTVFVLLQLLFFALGWLDLGYDDANGATATAIVSGVLALVAYFAGGFAAGSTIMWRGAKADGILHGALVWGLSVLVTLGLGLVSGSSLFGPVGQVAAQVSAVAAQPGGPATALLGIAQQIAGWSALFLGMAVVLSAIGGGLGTRERVWSQGRAAGDPG
jgi:hypothetical protein